jgi:hypothetical protein
MGYGIAYKTTRNVSALYKGAVSFAPSSLDYGPTSVTQYYNGVPLRNSETLVYWLNTSTRVPFCHVARSDDELRQVIGNLRGSQFSTLTEALNWTEGRDNVLLINKLIGNQRVSDVSVHFDSTIRASWAGGNSGQLYDMSPTGTKISGLNISNNMIMSGAAGYSEELSVLDNDSHSMFFEIEFTASESHPNGHTGSWEKFFGYNAGGSDRSPGIWRWPSSRTIHWRYDPGNTGCDFGKSPGMVEFDLNRTYHVGVVKNKDVAKAYVNGVNVETTNVAFPKRAGSASLAIFEYYSEKLCNIKSLSIFSRPLTDSEVMQVYLDGNVPTIGLQMALDSTNNASAGSNSWTNLMETGSTYYSGSIPDSSYMNSASHLTISLILEKTGYSTGYASHPINKWNSGWNMNASFILYHFGDYFGNGADGLLGWYGWTSAVGWSDLTGGNFQTRMKIGDIWHVVLQWNQDLGGQMWVNGNKIGGRTNGGRLGNTSHATSAVGTSGPNHDGLNKVHALNIYNRELSDDEIRAIFLSVQNRLTL